MEKIILHVITGLGRGGAERMLARLVVADRGLGAPRHIVVSLLNPGAYGEEIRQAGIELHCLRLNKFARLPIALARLVVLMRRSRPDVVMTWLYHADFIGILAAVMSGIGTRCVVWNLRCSNLDFSRYAWTTRWLARFLALLSPLPGAVATNSRSGQAAHAQMGYRPRCWFYLPNGLDLEKWSPEVIDRVAMRAELGITGKLVAVGMIARVDPQKDHSTFLAAVKLLAPRHPQARFILAGRNTEKLPASDGLLSLGERDDVQRVHAGAGLTRN